MKKLQQFLVILCLAVCFTSFYSCDEDGDTDCQLFGDCDGGGGGGGSSDCYAYFKFDNYDAEDYTVYSTTSGNEYYLSSLGDVTVTVTSNSCVTFYIYDGGVGGTYMGSYTACPCSYSDGSTVTVTVNF
jgi:hypothetical protein